MAQSDANLSSCTYPLKYMMEVTFCGIEESKTRDIGSFTAIRTPITKTGSFASLTVNIKYEDYANLQETISRNQYPNVDIECWICKNEDLHGDIYPPKVEDVFFKRRNGFS